MKKKIASLIFTLALLVGLISAMGIHVSAADEMYSGLYYKGEPLASGMYYLQEAAHRQQPNLQTTDMHTTKTVPDIA